MPRAIEWEEVVDTSSFSAVQLQPGRVASITWNALARWMRTHAISFPALISKESTGMVVMGFHLDFRDPVSFFDCDAFRVRAAFRIMRRGQRGQLNLRIVSDERELAVARLIVRPVAILDPISLGAEPAPLSDRVMACFRDDEIESASPERCVPERIALVESEGSLLAEHTHPFRIHRQLCEVAEQWSWTEVPALVESSRETLALDHRGDHRHSIRRCLSQRIDRFDVEFTRPFFSFDVGEIVTRAFDVSGHLGMVHRFTSNSGSRIHACVVEVFKSCHA
jgi:acyl-CoA thioesterase FadM